MVVSGSDGPAGLGAAAAGDARPAEPAPPPTPFERDRARRRSRRRRRLLVGAVLAAVAIAAAVVVRGGGLGVAGPAGPGPSDGSGAPAEDAAMLDLLRSVDRAESAMLGFSDASRSALESARSTEDGLVAVAAAAAAAVGDLETERAGLVVALPSAAAEEVRIAYLPHLDAWIEYLAEVADDPTELFAGSSDPAILRINATARTFALALAAALDAGVGPEAEAIGRGILEQGFPAQDDADL